MENSTVEERIQIFGGEYIPPDMKVLLRLEELIDKEYRNHRSIPFYCKELGITAGCLNNLTLAYHEKTVHDMLQHKLLIAAQHLLSNSLMSIKYITYELGFQDPAYFTRWFIKHTGLRPKVYRRENYKLKMWVW